MRMTIGSQKIVCGSFSTNRPSIIGLMSCTNTVRPRASRMSPTTVPTPTQR
jgi:heme O synthase-like polyprenyltransferase